MEIKERLKGGGGVVRSRGDDSLRNIFAAGLLLLGAAAAPAPILGQSYLIQVYTENDGLINNQSYGVVQDA